MQYKSVAIDPELATKLLEKNIRNRKPSAWWVAHLAREMSSGKWRESHQGIGVDVDGKLFDGQQRLMAIIRSGTTQRMWVATGVPREAVWLTDLGRRRTVAQNLAMMGIDISARHVATIRVVEFGASGFRSGANATYLSSERTAELYERHRDAIDFAFSCMPGSHAKGSNAILRGMVARASYSSDHELISQFCDILRTGDGPPESRPWRVVRLLRDQILSGVYSGNGKGSTTTRLTLYLKASRALRAFIDGQDPDKLYCPSGEIFHLPNPSAKALFDGRS